MIETTLLYSLTGVNHLFKWQSDPYGNFSPVFWFWSLDPQIIYLSFCASGIDSPVLLFLLFIVPFFSMKKVHKFLLYFFVLLSSFTVDGGGLLFVFPFPFSLQEEEKKILLVLYFWPYQPRLAPKKKKKLRLCSLNSIILKLQFQLSNVSG